ncbi:hypothetical protein FACS1894166_11970 [Bacilli bacterium]|nr:hypothetical protein FACS1894166_11970 [Bacilli bacterium]
MFDQITSASLIAAKSHTSDIKISAKTIDNHTIKAVVNGRIAHYGFLYSAFKGEEGPTEDTTPEPFLTNDA